MPAQPLNVTYLLAVWGESYIRQFMDMSLRSLLSDNNIPGLAKHTTSRFVFLTRTQDHAIFKAHPLFKRLSHYCDVDFISIDDLLFDGNYSATLTLAYERGMRAAGGRMLSTYFIYLVADYVMADGSLTNLLPYMQQGISGITAGNFQVVEEDLTGELKGRIEPVTGVLSIPPRELMALSLPHLHPVAAANLVDQNFSHTKHTNRLFWRVDAGTLVGRFYLRHMLCIKPEIDNYIIGSSCDYSYIAEMCPSGNVAHIADSDEYCVIELQPFEHEQDLVKDGPLNIKAMAAASGEWTTQLHRENIFRPVIFHADDIGEEAYRAVEETRRYVEDIDRMLPAALQPVRGHPYWLSCIEGVLASMVQKKNQEHYFHKGTFAGVVGSPTFEPPLGHSHGDYHLLKMTRYRYGKDWLAQAIKTVRTLSGDEAKGRIWHREFAHSRQINKIISNAAEGAQRFLLIAFDPTSYADWCHTTYGERAVLQKAELFHLRRAEEILQLAPDASHAIILLPVEHMYKLGELLAKCGTVLRGDRKVTIVVTKRYFGLRGKPLKHYLAQLATYYNSGVVELESFTTVTNPLRKWLDGLYRRQVSVVLARSLSPRSILKRVPAMMIIYLTCIGYIAGNVLSIRRRYPHRGNPTCAIIALKMTHQAPKE